MICKKCGAYNPDHATFCKVCAANLKEQTDTDEAIQAEDVEEAVEEKVRPRRGNVKAPDFSAARRDGSFKAVQKVEKPVEEEEEDEDLDKDEEEEEVKPAAKKSLFSRPAASAKKRRIVDEDEEEDDDEEEDEEDEYDEEDSDAEKLETEPKTTRFARSSDRKRPVEEEDDEDDDDDDEEEDDGYDDDDYDDDDDDGYEEYEPTPPRRKKSSHGRGKSTGGPNIVTLLIICLLAILLIIVGIVAFCNIKGGSTKSKLPGFLQFNCSGKASTEKTAQSQQQSVVPVDEPQSTDPTEAPVTGTPVDYSATELEEFVDNEGRPCISISMTSRPGDTVTIVLPNQDDYVIQNNEASDVPYLLTIFKSCYFPKKPLEESVYTVTPEILVTHADGTQDSLHVDSFDLSFPTVQLELTEPAQATIPEEGIMAAEGNELMLKGKVDDHTVTVTVNGQRVTNMYTGGYFDYNYSLTGEEAEVVTIEAVKDDYVSTSYSFTVLPYVFIPEKMTLDVESDITKLKADKNDKVTVTGTTVPGTTLTATPAAEYQSVVACGSPVVDAEGHFSIVVNFYKDYYGVATITIHAQKDGYDPGETTCTVARMYSDRSKFTKAKNFHQIPSDYEFAKVLENPNDTNLYRFEGSVVSIDAETGVITFAARSNKKNLKETTNIFVVNVSNWKPKVGQKCKLYCTLNGLSADGSSLCVVAWFYV